MDYKKLVGSILGLHHDSVERAAYAVNQALVLRNWRIGAHIVEFEQNGEDRAAYGEGLLNRLSKDLAVGGLRGSSPDMLERMRLLFRRYPQLGTQPLEAATSVLSLPAITPEAISAPPVRKSAADGPAPPPRSSS